jgi:hypothetical protein
VAKCVPGARGFQAFLGLVRGTLRTGMSGAGVTRRCLTLQAASKSRPLALVLVDCQLGQEEGKMKGSTKSPKMDEPFNM